jgi:hypothetical protein
MGYSVGHWDGDTLVVESNGFNDRTWLDFGGHPHSEDLRITERIRRRDFGHIDIEETLSDPKIYARPWTIVIHAALITDTEILEFVCAENEKDVRHLVGKAADERTTSAFRRIQRRWWRSKSPRKGTNCSSISSATKSP